ncbi:MAG: GNAT family N-acetyltransferase [Candidatus Binatales bacterium]
MELRQARPSERDEVLDLLAHWFDDRDFFARYNLNDPAFRDELCLVALDAGRIVSTVQIFDRKLNLGGQAVATGGIGSVYTLADYRKRGLAAALMRLSVDTLEREGFELSLLFAERLEFYGSFGWSSATRIFSVLPNAAQLPASGDFAIEPFDPARDLAEVSSIYASYSGRFDSTVVRSESYWRGNLIYAGNPDEYFVVCRARDGRIAAYARAIRFYGFPMIMEYGYRPAGAPAMLATFGHIANAVEKLPKPYFLGRGGSDPEGRSYESALPVTHSAHDPELEAALAAAGCAVLHHEDNYYMWRVISAERLGRRFDLPPAAAAGKVMAAVRNPGSVFWTSDRF